MITLKTNEAVTYRVMISGADFVRLYMFSDNETVNSKNAVGYISYDFTNIRPNAANHNQTISENATFVEIN